MEDTTNEIKEVVMSVRKFMPLMDPFAVAGSVGVLLLVTFLARMVKEKVLDKTALTDFTTFCKKADGEYALVNVPLKSEDIGEGERIVKQLDKQGLTVHLMPDLNKEDGYIQIAIANKDRQNFSSWFERYLRSYMRGGEHSMDELNRMTNDRTSIISIPFEGKEDVFVNDFQALQVNYAVLPDLRVGDGEVQLVVANADMQKVQQWYQLYQKQQLKNGVEVPDLQPIDLSTYANTGAMSEEEYVDTAEGEYKEANQKYEREEGEFEKEVKGSFGSKVRQEDNAAYREFETDISYQKFTINKESCVDVVPGEISSSLKQKGFFVSRVPRTYRENVRYLVVDADQVFRSMDGRTYTAFVKKSDHPMLIDGKGDVLPISKRPITERLFGDHYDLSKREKDMTQKFRNHEKVRNAKTPINPVKAK